MKRYVYDRLLYIMIMVSVITYSYIKLGVTILPVILTLIIIPGILFLFRDVIVLPLDLKCGIVKVHCRYMECLRVKKNDVLTNYGYCKLCFDVNGEDLVLTAPLPCYVWDIPQSFYPPKDEDLIVRYYKRSKIMISWEQIE